jgi:hypothetical protein
MACDNDTVTQGTALRREEDGDGNIRVVPPMRRR